MEENQNGILFQNKLQNYTNEELLNLDKNLLVEIQKNGITSSMYDKLMYQYSFLIDEMENRNLIKLPQ